MFSPPLNQSGVNVGGSGVNSNALFSSSVPASSASSASPSPFPASSYASSGAVPHQSAYTNHASSFPSVPTVHSYTYQAPSTDQYSPSEPNPPYTSAYSSPPQQHSSSSFQYASFSASTNQYSPPAPTSFSSSSVPSSSPFSVSPGVNGKQQPLDGDTATSSLPAASQRTQQNFSAMNRTTNVSYENSSYTYNESGYSHASQTYQQTDPSLLPSPHATPVPSALGPLAANRNAPSGAVSSSAFPPPGGQKPLGEDTEHDYHSHHTMSYNSSNSSLPAPYKNGVVNTSNVEGRVPSQNMSSASPLSVPRKLSADLPPTLGAPLPPSSSTNMPPLPSAYPVRSSSACPPPPSFSGTSSPSATMNNASYTYQQSVQAKKDVPSSSSSLNMYAQTHQEYQTTSLLSSQYGSASVSSHYSSYPPTQNVLPTPSPSSSLSQSSVPPAGLSSPLPASTSLSSSTHNTQPPSSSAPSFPSPSLASPPRVSTSEVKPQMNASKGAGDSGGTILPSMRGEVVQNNTDHTTSSSRNNSTANNITPLLRVPFQRIDPQLIPRPEYKGASEAVLQAGGKRYDTDRYIMPPPPCGSYTIVDKGSASCRFMRLTLNQIPAYSNTLSTSHFLMGCIVQPFAQLNRHEEPIPVVDLTAESLNAPKDAGSAGYIPSLSSPYLAPQAQPSSAASSSNDNKKMDGPVRCPRCKAYINPFMSWATGGKECACNLCQHSFTLPDFYANALEAYAHRNENDSENDRPELWKGSVDFVAPTGYSEKVTQPPAFCFVVEATYPAVASYFTGSVLQAIRQVLPQFPSAASDFSLITFDDCIHFYSIDTLNPSTSHQLLVMPDIDEPFCPAPVDQLCVNAFENQQKLDALLASAPSFLVKGRQPLSAGNAALQAAVNLLSERGGGVVLMFYATVPEKGLGAIRKRDPKDKENDKPIRIYENDFYEKLLKKCYQNSVSVDVFCYTTGGAIMEIPTLGFVARQTGGKILHCKDFKWHRDYDKLYYDVLRRVTCVSGYDCTFKIRCSKGLNISKIVAPFYGPNVLIDQTSFKIPRIDADTAIAFIVNHEDQLENQKQAFFQCVVLHTTVHGQRLLRVHTLAAPVTTSLSSTHRFAEVVSLVSLLIRKASQSVLNGSTTWKDELTNKCVDILHSYRINCAMPTSAGQLILPESLKFLPLYLTAAFKSKAFRSTDVHPDERALSLISNLYLPVSQFVARLYPRVFCLHRSFPSNKSERLSKIKMGLPTEVDDNVYLPESVAATGESIMSDGIYLCDAGTDLIMYIGKHVKNDVIQQLFGIESLDHQREDMSKLKLQDESSGDITMRTLKIIEQIRKDRFDFPYMPLTILCSKPADELALLPYLVEDKQGAEPSYMDFLCLLHKLVYNKLDD